MKCTYQSIYTATVEYTDHIVSQVCLTRSKYYCAVAITSKSFENLIPFQTPFTFWKQEIVNRSIVSRIHNLCTQTSNSSQHPLSYHSCELVHCPAKSFPHFFYLLTSPLISPANYRKYSHSFEDSSQNTVNIPPNHRHDLSY